MEWSGVWEGFKEVMHVTLGSLCRYKSMEHKVT